MIKLHHVKYLSICLDNLSTKDATITKTRLRRHHETTIFESVKYKIFKYEFQMWI